MNAELEHRAALIEQARRDKSYDDMERHIAEFDEALRAWPEYHFFKERARVRYEEAMAQFDQGQGAQSDVKRHAHYERGLRFCDESVDLALKANDTVGVMYAYMIKAGHLLAALERFEEATPLLTLVVDDVEFLESIIAPEAKKRLRNVAMNCKAHLLNFHLDHMVYSRPLHELLRDFLKDVEELGVENEPWVKAIQDKAEDRLAD